MDPVAQFLLAVASIFLIGAVGEIIFERTSIPDALWLIAAGVLLGPILGWVTPAQLNRVAPYFAALTLVVVLFEGGTAIKLRDLAQAAPRAGALALSTFAFAVLWLTLAIRAVVWVGWLPESWGWLHCAMVGCILGGPSSIIIMPAMERAKLPAPLANLVGLESSITDAFCVVGTAAMIDLLLGRASGSPAMTLLRSFGLALVIGLVAGFAWLVFLRMLKASEHAYPITLSVLLLLYVAIDAVGGSAALGILTVAIVLGNAGVISKRFDMGEGFELGGDVRGFHSRMAFIIKSLFFTFMGMMLGPPWGLLALGVVLGVVIFASRLPGASLAMLGSKFDKPSRGIVLLSMPRGMAAGVLATLPMSAGIADTGQLPVFVFSCIVTTIAIFAVGFPMARSKLAGEGGSDRPSESPVAEAAGQLAAGQPQPAVGVISAPHTPQSPGAAAAPSAGSPAANPLTGTYVSGGVQAPMQATLSSHDAPAASSTAAAGVGPNTLPTGQQAAAVVHVSGGAAPASPGFASPPQPGAAAAGVHSQPPGTAVSPHAAPYTAASPQTAPAAPLPQPGVSAGAPQAPPAGAPQPGFAQTLLGVAPGDGDPNAQS
jgi:cell volume regulation protein A